MGVCLSTRVDAQSREMAKTTRNGCISTATQQIALAAGLSMRGMQLSISATHNRRRITLQSGGRFGFDHLQCILHYPLYLTTLALCPPSTESEGGGLCLEASIVKITDTIIQHNRATIGGGTSATAGSRMYLSGATAVANCSARVGASVHMTDSQLYLQHNSSSITSDASLLQDVESLIHVQGAVTCSMHARIMLFPSAQHIQYTDRNKSLASTSSVEPLDDR